MTFMQEGGVFMWVILLTALAALGWAMARGQGEGPTIAFGGALLCLAFGAVGFALGIGNVLRFVETFTGSDPDKLEVALIGLKEASRNLLLGGGLASLVTVVGVAQQRRHDAPPVR